MASIVRRKRRGESSFPHSRPEPVQVGHCQVQLYSFGQDLYDDMLAAIDGASESVYLETFLWKGDDTGKRFKECLIRKANEGVDVYVIYDHFGNLVVPPTFKMFPQPVHALGYRAMTRPWHALDLRHYALEHRKLLVVDGRTAFIGGYNIGADYATKWRDTHLRIDGPNAADLAMHFADFWNGHVPEGERISRHYRRHFDPLIHVEGNNASQLTFPIRDMYIEAIDTAEACIRLTSAYFVPDSGIIASLLKARDRGVEVQILVPWVSNHVVTDWLARGYFTELLHAGVRVFGFQTMLHAKTCTIDGQWSTVGTANLDRLSALGNYEINVELYSEALARQMEDQFERDVSHATELRWEKWVRRPWHAKLGEAVLEPLRNLM
ncbi:MAG: phosphatidylserine/phosphatidylglycerophosphate/cardiolipin synthase family protein [Chloroflexota bacterium]